MTDTRTYTHDPLYRPLLAAAAAAAGPDLPRLHITLETDPPGRPDGADLTLARWVTDDPCCPHCPAGQPLPALNPAQPACPTCGRPVPYAAYTHRYQHPPADPHAAAADLLHGLTDATHQARRAALTDLHRRLRAQIEYVQQLISTPHLTLPDDITAVTVDDDDHDPPLTRHLSLIRGMLGDDDDRPGVTRHRGRWAAWCYALEPDSIVYLDEHDPRARR